MRGWKIVEMDIRAMSMKEQREGFRERERERRE